MSATMLQWRPRHCGPSRSAPIPVEQPAANVIPFPAPRRLLSQSDLNALRLLMMKTQGGWRCEWSPEDRSSAQILPDGFLSRRSVEFSVSRDGSRLILSVGGAPFPGRRIGAFDSQETLIDALSDAIAARMRHGDDEGYSDDQAAAAE